MTHTYSCPTYSATELFEVMNVAIGDMIAPIETASPGDICGFVADLSSAAGKGGHATAYPVVTFLVMDQGGALTQTHYREVRADRRAQAAELAMEINLAGIVDKDCVIAPLDDLDTGDSDLRTRLLYLPAVALVHVEHYEDLIDTCPGEIEDNQVEIDRHFALLRRGHASSHAALQWHDTERRELAAVQNAAPIHEDYSEDGSARLEINFQEAS